MAAANQHFKLIFVKRTNEPHHEKEHVDISDTAKFQSSGPNAGEMADIFEETNLFFVRLGWTVTRGV